MKSSRQTRNRVLEHLPSAELKAVCRELKPVVLPRDAVLFEADESVEHIYFPHDAVVSFLGDTGEGGRIEVWGVGNEGIAGISGLLARSSPYRGVVQVPGTALVGNAASLRRQFRLAGRFHEAVLKYYESLVVQVGHLGICNNLHSVEQRFCRWLLMIQDRVGSRDLTFTQDSIAGILGTRRATISVAAAALQQTGLISYTPGSITIKSRVGLQRRVCGCYRVIKSWE